VRSSYVRLVYCVTSSPFLLSSFFLGGKGALGRLRTVLPFFPFLFFFRGAAPPWTRFVFGRVLAAERLHRPRLRLGRAPSAVCPVLFLLEGTFPGGTRPRLCTLLPATCTRVPTPSPFYFPSFCGQLSTPTRPLIHYAAPNNGRCEGNGGADHRVYAVRRGECLHFSMLCAL
jgi:hypothetical protein